MKNIKLVLLSLCLVSLAEAGELCGYISQENEGTWLEIPYANNDSAIETVYTLEGEGVYELEQGAAVCVSFEQAPSQEKLVQVTKIKEWIRN